MAAAGTKVLGTVSFGSPVFGVFAEDNKPRFRDGKPWPEGIIDGVRLGEEAGYMPVNARTIWGLRHTKALQAAYLTGLAHTVGMGSRLLLTPVVD